MDLVTWNIQWGKGCDGVVDLARIVTTARALADADVFCFQEIAINFPLLDEGKGEDQPTAANPLGVKGSGQAGCIAAPQTVVNAVLDAVAPLGIAHLDMPLTPERVWRAIRDARA